MADRILTFLMLLGGWCLFSGQFDAFHLSAGALCALLIAATSGGMWFAGGPRSLRVRIRQGAAFAAFLVWLVGQVVVANCYVIFLALHPRSRELVSPRFVRFRTRLRSDFARFALANSITLTPGTITVRVEGDEFLVHAINGKTAEGLPGAMEDWLLRIFEPESLSAVKSEEAG